MKMASIEKPKSSKGFVYLSLFINKRPSMKAKRKHSNAFA
jgi:hypothetical protein